MKAFLPEEFPLVGVNTEKVAPSGMQTRAHIVSGRGEISYRFQFIDQRESFDRWKGQRKVKAVLHDVLIAHPCGGLRVSPVQPRRPPVENRPGG